MCPVLDHDLFLCFGETRRGTPTCPVKTDMAGSLGEVGAGGGRGRTLTSPSSHLKKHIEGLTAACIINVFLLFPSLLSISLYLFRQW